MTLLLSFLGGFCVECLAVLWVAAANRGSYKALWVIGCAQALAQVVGIGNAIGGNGETIAYVLGFSVGPLIGVWIRKRVEDREDER